MQKVLIVDDQPADITWLLDILESKGYAYEIASHEEKARELLQEVKRGEVHYALAIFDVMVAIRDMRSLVRLDPTLLKESTDTGVRLCYFARKELKISPKTLPIVCISARPDRDQFLSRLKKLKVPLFSRIPEGGERSIRDYIDEKLSSLIPKDEEIETEEAEG